MLPGLGTEPKKISYSGGAYTKIIENYRKKRAGWLLCGGVKSKFRIKRKKIFQVEWPPTLNCTWLYGHRCCSTPYISGRCFLIHLLLICAVGSCQCLLHYSIQSPRYHSTCHSFLFHYLQQLQGLQGQLSKCDKLSKEGGLSPNFI